MGGKPERDTLLSQAVVVLALVALLLAVLALVLATKIPGW